MAIAFDSVGQAEQGASTLALTWTHTNVGSPTIGKVYLYVTNAAVDPITSVTWNGVGMTLAQARVAKGGSATEFSYEYIIANPGSGTVSMNVDGLLSHISLGFSMAYTGADTTLDTTNQKYGTQNGTGATSASTTVTTTVDNSWATVSLFSDGGNPTAGTNSTQRGTTHTIGPFAVYDSNGAITPAGAFSQDQSFPSSGYVTLQGSFAPTGGGGGAKLLQLLGVGK